MPAFILREDDPESFRTFVATLDRNDEKTVATYLTTLRDLATWLATQPDGIPFHPALLTVTALEGYFAHLEAEQRAPRTRAKALTAITRFCRWAIDAGQLQRNPAHQIKPPDRAGALAHRTLLRAAHRSQEPRRAPGVVACGGDLCAGLLGWAAGQRGGDPPP